MAFKRKNKNRNEVNYKITIDQLHKTMSQNFIEEFKSLKSLKEKKNSLEVEIEHIKQSTFNSQIPNFSLQNNMWKLENELESLNSKIVDIENNKMEKSYLLKSGKLLNNYYKLLNKEKQNSKNVSLLDFDFNTSSNELSDNNTNTSIKNDLQNINTGKNKSNLSNIDNGININKNINNLLKNNNLINDNLNLPKDTEKIDNLDTNKKKKKNVLDWLNYDVISAGDTSFSNNCDLSNLDELKDNKVSKKKIYDDYMRIIDKNYIPQNENENIDDIFDICVNCKSEMALNHNTGMLNCKGCGMTEKIIIDSDKQSHKDPPKEMTSFSYKRINHLTEILSQFQAKETTDIPDYIYDKILLELKKERIHNMCSLTTDKLRHILKKIDETDYYEHMPYIINQLNGLPPPVISPEVEEIIKSLFLQTQYPFNKYCPDDRKNFLTYGYTLYKLFELLELDEYLINFKFLKNRKKLYAQEQVWKKICNELKWEFIPSL